MYTGLFKYMYLAKAMTLEKMQQGKLFDSITETNLPGCQLPRDLDLN